MKPTTVLFCRFFCNMKPLLLPICPLVCYMKSIVLPFAYILWVRYRFFCNSSLSHAIWNRFRWLPTLHSLYSAWIRIRLYCRSSGIHPLSIGDPLISIVIQSISINARLVLIYVRWNVRLLPVRLTSIDVRLSFDCVSIDRRFMFDRFSIHSMEKPSLKQI